MAKKKIYSDIEFLTEIVAESKSAYGLKTYISLFSSAGVGCYGFKQEGYYCIATVELLERRLNVQKCNNKCAYNSGYICGDMTEQSTKDKIFRELDIWKHGFGVDDLDVLIATPPCQGMSVANHKKKDELKRNSLVVESILMVKSITPKFFIFENVRAFLTSVCTDLDGNDKSIREAIEANLSGLYNISYNVLNFKDYGNPSSRTRTLVIGVRKDLKEITPYDVFPDKQPEQTLRQVIGDMPSLQTMGEICPDDIYHNFRKYAPRMEAWISEIKEGQSAFDNTEISRIPHTVKDGVIVYNAQKNGDKYTRQYWDKVAPCIHTRNDIMASQNTVHPVDNRVFSIREVMRMMSVPPTFKWSEQSLEELNALSVKEKEAYLKKEEINIRQTLGEAVPTIIFKQIAHKVRKVLCRSTLSEQDIKKLIEKRNLTDAAKLIEFIKKSTTYTFAELSKIAELANAQHDNNAAYYTRQDLCFTIVSSLPIPKGQTTVNILEPSIGVGNFLPTLIRKYESATEVNIDVVDIDANSIAILKELVQKIYVPANVHITYINDDFLLHQFDKKYDVVVGNPPYMKLTKEKKLLAQYKAEAYNKNTNNIFAFFIEKAIKIGKFVSLIVPKSLINAPEFNDTRELIGQNAIRRIIDFGEGFKGVKIETICLQVDTVAKQSDTVVESYITDEVECHPQSYITSLEYPYWLIYRNAEFDKVADRLTFNVFKSYRDRTITKAITKPTGRIRVLKSRNIGDNTIIDIPDYDSYIDDVNNLDVAKYLNQTECVLLPNLTYNPRACFMPKGCIADGSVAILTPNENETITEQDLAFYATELFSHFYAIARNRGSRSLNIDNNSVYFFGKLKHTTL